MNRTQLNKYVQWYDDYVESFIAKDSSLEKNIRIKQVHSKNVCFHSKQIAYSINLSENDITLAEFIGLFHDVGRFEQYYKYRTFSDSKSQNHGELGVKVLNEHSIFNDLDKSEKQIIETAILNHSKAKIEEGLGEKELLFSKLIRDADKLDIWRLVVEYYYNSEPGENQTIELELPNDPRISDKVCEAIMNKKVVLKEDMETLNDFKMMQAGWVYDLNFSFSKEQVKHKGYIKRILDSMHNTDEIMELKNLLLDEFEIA